MIRYFAHGFFHVCSKSCHDGFLFLLFAQEIWKAYALMKSVLKGHILVPTFMTVSLQVNNVRFEINLCCVGGFYFLFNTVTIKVIKLFRNK